MAKTTAKIGKKISSLKLPGTQGEFDFSKYKGQNVVLYFYPKDATPGCTIEGHEFSKLLPQFKKLNAVVFGVSRDSMKSHDKFKEKEGYTVDLISDEDSAACDLFDVIKEKNMYGKKVMGIERSTFWIDAEGVLKHEWRKVKAEGHAAEVLKYLKEHS